MVHTVWSPYQNIVGITRTNNKSIRGLWSSMGSSAYFNEAYGLLVVEEKGIQVWQHVFLAFGQWTYLWIVQLQNQVEFYTWNFVAKLYGCAWNMDLKY